MIKKEWINFETGLKIQRLYRLLLHVSKPMTNALMCVCSDGLGSKLVLLSRPVIGGAGSLGHSRTGGLWPPETPLLSRHRCDPNVFLHRQPWQFGWDFLFVNVFFFLSSVCICSSMFNMYTLCLMQRIFQRSGLRRWSTSVPMCPLSLWETRKTCEMTSTHVES